LLFSDVTAGERVNLSFLGGEPLMNRPVIRLVTEHARMITAERGVDVTFSITTNGTQLTAQDGEFFEEHGFAVTVSLDSVGAAHGRLRPFRGGQGSFDRVIERVMPQHARDCGAVVLPPGSWQTRPGAGVPWAGAGA
jgi:uncharacterized protein